MTTDSIGSPKPFYWDLAAFCFRHADRSEADVPGLRHISLPGGESREWALEDWVEYAKRLSEADRDDQARKLAEALGVDVPKTAFSDLMLDWDQVRTLADEDVTIGAHTRTHAILSQCTDDRVFDEVVGAKARIEEETGRPCRVFAFPNGQAIDYTERDKAILAEAGFEASFTLAPGPVGFAAAGKDPFAVRRTLIGYSDTKANFIGKTMGLRRLTMAIKGGSSDRLWGA